MPVAIQRLGGGGDGHRPASPPIIELPPTQPIDMTALLEQTLRTQG